MWNQGKHSLWKTIGKQDHPQDHSSRVKHQQEQYADYEITTKKISSSPLVKINEPLHSQRYTNPNRIDPHNPPSQHHVSNPSPPRPGKSPRPPPLVIQSNLINPYINQHQPQSQRQQHYFLGPQHHHLLPHQSNIKPPQSPMHSAISNVKKISRKIILNSNNCEEQQPQSPWIDVHGDRISCINKRDDQHVEDLSFSIDKENVMMSKVQKKNLHQGLLKKAEFSSPYRSLKLSRPEQNYEDHFRSYNSKIPVMQTKQGILISRVHYPSSHHTADLKQVQQMFQPDYQQQNRGQFSPQKVHLPKNQTFTKRQAQIQAQLKTIKQKLTLKDNKLLKLRFQIKHLKEKLGQVKELVDKDIKSLPQKLKQFRQKQIIRAQNEIQQKMTQIQWTNRKFSQGFMEEQFHKRKQLQTLYNETKKKLTQLQTQSLTFQHQKAKLQKQIRQLQFSTQSSSQQYQQMTKKVKQLQQEKIQLRVQIQTLEERNKSMKQHLAAVSKNVQQKTSNQGEDEEEWFRKYKRVKKQMDDKQGEIKGVKDMIQKIRQEQQKKLDQYGKEYQEVQFRMNEYKKRTQMQIDELREQAKQQKLLLDQEKQLTKNLQLKLKSQQLQHYKQIQTYDKTLRQIQKDLEILSLKKNLKEEQLNKKQLEIHKKQNQLTEQMDSLRQQKNQLECAVELYKKNLLILEKKEGFLSQKYHEAVQIQSSTKAAWYERYYKLYSPSAITKANCEANFNNNSNNSTANKIYDQNRPNTQVPKNQRTPFTEPPFYGDLRKQAIQQRLSQISNHKSRKVSRQHSPNQLSTKSRLKQTSPQPLSKPQSPRPINLVHKAKSLQTQRIFVKSPLRQRPQKDHHNHNLMTNLSVAKSVNSSKPLTKQFNKEFSVVKAKLDQIKTSINNEMTAQYRSV